MWELVWLDSAINDVVRLKGFIAKENPDAAQRAAMAIKNMTECLRQFPDIGKPVDGLTAYRDLLVRFGAGGYVLRYRTHLDVIYIVHVRHYRESNFTTRLHEYSYSD